MIDFKSSNSINEYILAQPESTQIYLNKVRDTIRKVLPNVEERISWGMPTFWKGKNIIHFAACKKHIGLYPGEEAIIHFADKLSDYKTTKGAIQFPYKFPLPLELISEITKWCYITNNDQSIYSK